MPRLTETLARRAVERSVADRQSQYLQEIQRIVEATYALIERSGSVDPSLRDILRETGLSTQAFYRYFQSKDELLLLLLDDGRSRLVGYLEHRMASAATPEDQVRAWIEGVLAQATNPEAASRTRPFVANQDRLAEAFPEEHQASIDLLIGLLAGAIEKIPDAAMGKTRRRNEARADATAIYHLAFGTLHSHLTHRTRPSAAQIDHLVRFSLSGTGGPSKTTRGR
jgi:AcrR family transcriptional regulator